MKFLFVIMKIYMKTWWDDKMIQKMIKWYRRWLLPLMLLLFFYCYFLPGTA